MRPHGCLILLRAESATLASHAETRCPSRGAPVSGRDRDPVYGSGLEASEGRRRQHNSRDGSPNPLHLGRIGDSRKQMEAGCSRMSCKRSSVRARLAPSGELRLGAVFACVGEIAARIDVGPRTLSGPSDAGKPDRLLGRNAFAAVHFPGRAMRDCARVSSLGGRRTVESQPAGGICGDAPTGLGLCCELENDALRVVLDGVRALAVHDGSTRDVWRCCGSP
jgi:hypothetical protein